MPAPDLIGRYRLGPRLGSGGFAVVWLAHDESLDTQIAIKVMSEHWADRMDLRERFLTEARMLRRAASNRVVQVFDIGELPDGRPYFVMDFADRGTLADRAQDGPLPLVEALRLTAEVARGAAELHQAGILHRDLKPSNVLIRSAAHGPDRLLIADLGVAKSLAQASGLTMSVGSAGYMAPEQSGPNSGVDVTADVYSLGAIAYRLITGEVPGMPGFVLWESARADRPAVPDLPPPVRKVLQRAMEVDRTKRWPDASTLAVQLDQLADQFSVSRRRPRLGRRSLAALATLAVIGIVAGGFGVAQMRKFVPVEDVTKQISMDVPREWVGPVQPNRWNPKVIGLASSDQPGMVVSQDAKSWASPSSLITGVFVGISTDPNLPLKVTGKRDLATNAITTPGLNHQNCTRGTLWQYQNTYWTGMVQDWVDCTVGNRTVTEVSLTSKDSRGAAPTQAYLQIRDYGDSKITRHVLDNLRVSSS
jgi:serine/threonine protein kinase